MSCQTMYHPEELPILFEDIHLYENDEDLNIKYLKKYFQVNTINQKLKQQRKEFQTRSEHLQKRQQALQQREIIFKEKMISYEIYIKELTMKRDRFLKQIDDEKLIRKKKQIEIDLLKQDINKMQEEKHRLEIIIQQYQPHLDLLTQIVDRTDRFHSIDEMIEKFDVLHTSYQNILKTMNDSNEKLNDLQRQLLLTIEKKNNRISLMNNRIHQFEQNLFDIKERIKTIHMKIIRSQQILKEQMIENSAITIAIESMFDLIKRYNHRSRRKDCYGNNQSLFEKLQRIDVFLSDLVYYIDYVNNKPKKIQSTNQSIIISNKIIDEINDQSWKNSCEVNQRIALNKDQQTYVSYQIRGEDNTLYTIQLMNINQKKSSNLTPHQSTLSMILPNIEKKINHFSTVSTSKVSTIQSIQTMYQSSQIQNIPFQNSK